MTNLFISYSSEDKSQVVDIVDDLESLGHKIWFDNELIGGQSWWDRILREIESCDFYLCALSGSYLKSDACKRELSYAVSLGKTIIPLKITADYDNRFLPPELAKLQITDVESGNKKGVLALIKAINIASPSPVVPDPLPTPPEIPVSYISELLATISAAEPLNQDQQASIFFKLRDHFRTSGDADGVLQALHKLEARKDLLASIGREVDAFKHEIQQSSLKEKVTSDGIPDDSKSESVFRKDSSANKLKDDLKEVVETGKSDGAAIGFAIASFFIPILGFILFFVWRKEKPKRAKLIIWAAAAGFFIFLVLSGDSSF